MSNNVWCYNRRIGWVQWLRVTEPPEIYAPGGGKEYLEIVLRNVHSQRECQGRACVIHNPSEHHMRDWPLIWRNDRGIFERICTHGVGHPDPDQRTYWCIQNTPWEGVHGCDFCCRPEI